MMSPFRSCAGSSVMHTRSRWPGPMWLKAAQEVSEPGSTKNDFAKVFSVAERYDQLTRSQMNKPLAFPGKPWCTDSTLQTKWGRKNNEIANSCIIIMQWRPVAACWLRHSCLFFLSVIICCCGGKKGGILSSVVWRSQLTFGRNWQKQQFTRRGREFPWCLTGACKRGHCTLCLRKRLSLPEHAGVPAKEKKGSDWQGADKNPTSWLLRCGRVWILFWGTRGVWRKTEAVRSWRRRRVEPPAASKLGIPWRMMQCRNNGEALIFMEPLRRLLRIQTYLQSQQEDGCQSSSISPPPTRSLWPLPKFDPWHGWSSKNIGNCTFHRALGLKMSLHMWH